MRLEDWWRQPAMHQSLARLVAAPLQGALLVMLGVRIHASNGKISEERTYPRGAGPRRSRG